MASNSAGMAAHGATLLFCGKASLGSEVAQLLQEAAPQLRLVISESASAAVEQLADAELILVHMDGAVEDVMQVLERVGGEAAATPVIVLGPSGREELVVELMRAGANDYIRTNSLTRLVPAVERELKENALRRERRRARESLLESELRFRQLTENIHDVFWLIDCDSNQVVYLSHAFETVWERPREALYSDASSLLEWVHPEDHERLERALLSNHCGAINAEYRILLPDEGERWVNTRSFPIYGSHGELVRMAGLTTDVTERKRLEQESATLTRALEQSADVVMITNAEGLIEYVNSAFEDVTGFSKEEAIGSSPNILKSGFQDEAFYRSVWDNLKMGLPFTDVFINRRKDGELYYETKTITPMRDGRGDITHFVSTGKDITQRLKIQERMQHLVHYDAVTGLPNRVLFVERLMQASRRASRSRNQLGVMIVGMELDSLLSGMSSRVQGEHLLKKVAERLHEACSDEGSVAVVDKNAFAILVDNDPQQEELIALARRVVAIFADPLKARGYELYLTPYIGISIYPDDGEESGQLLKRAQQALEEERTHGGERYRFYHHTGMGHQRLSS